ncbi:MAG TPA: aminopeptidase P N-terminal domain-containing protein [Gemmatimonas sp.]|nr:aminopeptidase P N-terminal domain-containing protein [Gemmatimonas sp.]
MKTRHSMRARTGLAGWVAVACTSPLLLSHPFVSEARAQQPLAIASSEYAARRDSLAVRLDSGVVVAFGGRTPVTDYGPFYQLPAFHYLTGYDEPDAAFVLVARGGKATHWTFVSPMEPRRAFYYGARTDSATLSTAQGLATRPYSALSGVLDSLAKSNSVFYQLADFAAADFAGSDSLTRGLSAMRGLLARNPGVQIRDGHGLVNRLRARKSAAELALLRKAVAASDAGHRAAMLAPEPSWEYEIQATVESEFLRLGATRPAYGSIVGAGRNGTVLHYMKNRGPARPGDLVVIDAGAEFDGYAADVTRTLPVSGRYTTEQRALYDLVLQAQLAAERNSKPGMLASAATDSSVAIRVRGLAKLGLIESEDALFDPPWHTDCARTPKACSQAQLWMIHGISHGIGLEVHDPAQFYEGKRTFEVGDAFTIEPGIYISTASLDVLPDTPRNRAFISKVKSVAARYENSGVRIEDDYVITAQGLERLSRAPREIPEIEALMAKRAPKRITP